MQVRGRKSAIVRFPGSNGGGGNSTASASKGRKAINKVHSLDSKLAGLANNYFSIDLEKLHEAPDEQLAAYADRAIAMQKLIDVLPILEKHFKMLIEGQVAYEQFLANTQKEVAAGAKAIDKNILDAWLVSKGYEQHLKVMGEKARVGVLKLEAETQNTIQLSGLDHSSAMQIVALRYDSRVKEINGRLPMAKTRQAIADQERESRNRRKDLLTYGTRSEEKRGFFSNLRSWFAGS